MKQSRKLFASVLLSLAVFTAFGFSAGLVKPVAANSSMFSSYVTNQSDYYFTRGSVTVNNMNVPQLFNFTSNGENDIYWYPGVIGSVKTSGNGGAGTKYTQTLDFGGVTLTSYLEILGRIPNNLVVQKATGAFENYAIYVYTPAPKGGATLTIYSAVKKAPGVTVEGLEFILNNTFPMLLNYLGKTGTFSVWVG